MAKPTKHATAICTAISVLLVIGIVLGFWQKNVLYILGFLLPAVIYQVYRTEGKSTKWASLTMLIVIILEFILVIFKSVFLICFIHDVVIRYKRDFAYICCNNIHGLGKAGCMTANGIASQPISIQASYHLYSFWQNKLYSG